MSYVKKAVNGTLFLLAGAAASMVLAYLVRIILARNLTVEEYGLFFAVYAAITMALFLRSLGLDKATERFLPFYLAKKQKAKAATVLYLSAIFHVGMSTLIAIGFLLAAEQLATHYFKSEVAKTLISYFFIYLVLNGIFVYLKSVCVGLQRTKIFSLIRPVQNISLIISLTYFFMSGHGIFSAIYAYIFSQIASAAIAGVGCLPALKLVRHKPGQLKAVTKDMFAFGLPSTVTSVGGRIVSQVDTLILTGIVSLSAVGLYNVVLPAATAIFYFSTPFGTLFMPMITELYAKEKSKDIIEAIQFIYRHLFILVLPVTVVGTVYAKDLLSLFFGADYGQAAFEFQLLLIASSIMLLAKLNYEILSAIGKPVQVTKIILATAVVNVILNVMLIPALGILGAAIATGLAYLLAVLLSTFVTRQYFSFYIPIKQWIVTASLAFFYAVGVIGLAHVMNFHAIIEMVIAGTVIGCIYLVVLYYTRLLDVQQIRTYWRNRK